MTLPSSGKITLSDVNVELGRAADAPISLNDSVVRNLAGKSAGAIAMSDLYGKTHTFPFAIASNQTNADLRTLALNAGWNGTTKVVATINSGIYVSSNSTGTPALTVNGSFPNGVRLVNNGFVVGMGGNGGAGGVSNTTAAPTAGAVGGPALSAQVLVEIDNSGTIAGGGGGGGGGAGALSFTNILYGGGGGGGRSSNAANSSGGSGGGGSAQPGGQGTLSAPGAGGARSASGAGNGATGGQWGASGETGGSGFLSGAPGGAGGAAVSGNSNITWLATGTRLGAIQ
jgi:hypothetical protein